MNEITVLRADYLQLRQDQAELRLLQAAGVDNWQGCDDAFDDWEDIQRKIESEVAQMK